MALSQIQCLDDNHINPRTNESKPDFLYSEDQRLALETLLGDGREAFLKYLEARGLRGFLSDLEQETLAGAVEPYDPGSEVFPEGADEDEPPLSLHYWPELSDTSVPLMDLGWPDSDAYRGVTRTTVYTQPPLEGQAHVKEIVRKMIAQAQKVIAVVMDAFTDVDIFRDLLDASFKRRVSVYILLEHRMLPHFLSMCRRANMHAGHLKHLRVRCSEGTEFYTRSCTKVRGQMGHRFMFIDGDKAVSGSYSFTWMSSRLDRNLITVVTGQAVDVFDRLFRCLYMNSKFVDLLEVAVAPEPEPGPVPQPVSVPLPSAALARKLYNPKYALVTVGNHSPASTPSPGNNSPKDSQAPDETEKKKRRRRRSLEAQEAPPLHPGLVNLEKAALIAYLPTWPEPDPPSDVIGFINIRDSNKPSPVHLQRSEMFGTSQAIRFSSPISAPKDTLPEVAKPRQVTMETKVRSEHQQTQDKSKAEEPTKLHNRPVDVATKNKEPEQKPAASALKSAPVKNNTEALNTQHNLNSNTPDTRPPLLSSSKPPTPNTESPSDATLTVSTNKLVSLPAANAGKETQTKPSLNTKQSVMTENTNHTQEVKNTHLHTDSNPVAEKTGAHTPTSRQSQFAPEIQVSASSAAITHPLPVSSTCDTTHVPIAAAQPSAAPRPSPSPPPEQLATSPYTSLMSTPPIPKPRTIHLISRDASSKRDPLRLKQPDNPARQPSVDNSPQTLPDAENSTATTQVDSGNVGETQQKKTLAEMEAEEDVGSRSGNSPQTLPDAENSTAITQVDSGNVGETQQKKTLAEMEVEQDAGSRSGTQTGPAAALQIQSDALIASRPNAESMHIQEAVLARQPSVDNSPQTLPDAENSTAITQVDSGNVGETQQKKTLAEMEVEEDVGSRSGTQTGPAAALQTQSDALIASRPNAESMHIQEAVLARQPSVDNSPQTLPDAENSTAITQVDSGNVGETQQKKTLAEMEVEEDVGSRSGTQTGPAAALQTQSDALIASRPNAESMHIQEAVSKEAEREALMSGDGDVTPKPQSEPVHTEKTETRADREIAEEVPNLIRENVTQSESHLERPDETLSASSCEANSGTTKTLKAETQDGTDVEESCAPSPAENNTQGTSKEEEACTQTPSRPVGLSLCNSHAPELRSPTPEKESLLLDSLMRSPTPDVLLQRTPTPDFHTPTPDFRSATPDFRTPTPVSDGYTSTKEDSTTSDEYYECSDSPVPEPAREAATEGRATSTTPSPTHVVEDSAAKTADKQKEAQTPRRKKAASKPAAETQADGGATPVESTAKQTEPKRSSTCDLKAEKTGISKGAPAPAVEKKSDKLPASRDSGGHTQQGVVAFQSSQQPQQSRPQRSFSTTQLAGSQSWGSALLNQVDPKAHHGSTRALDYTSSSRKAPHSSAPPHAAAHKHAAPHGQQGALSRQARARGGPPPTSFLQQRNPPSQNRTAEAQESHRQEEGRVPFSFSFSRLYTLKGLRERIGKIPAQSKRSSTSSPAQNHHHSSS